MLVKLQQKTTSNNLIRDQRSAGRHDFDGGSLGQLKKGREVGQEN
jgi:hypothetical protein